MVKGAEQAGPITLKTEEVVVTGKQATTDQDTEVSKNLDELSTEVQENLKQSYANIVKLELNKKIKAHLALFLQRLESPDLVDLKLSVINMNSQELQLYQSFMDPTKREEMSYENVCKLYQAVKQTVKASQTDVKQSQNLGILTAAQNGLQAMSLFVDYNIPDLMVKAKQITIMQETRFTRTPIKKSLFRRFIEAVFPFVEKKPDEIVKKKIVEKITSPEKAVLGYATSAIAESFGKPGEDYFKAFDNAVEYKKQAAQDKVMNLMPTQEQGIKEQEKKKQSEKTKVEKVVDVALTVANVVRAVDTGVNEWIVAKLNSTAPGAYLEQVLKPGTDVQQTTLAEHFRNEFMMASQTQAYEGMVHFTRRLAEIYITANRVKQTGYVDIAAEQFGFKQIDDPKFEIFLSRLVRSLGYPMEGFDDLQQFLSNSIKTSELQQKDFPSKAVFENYKSEIEAAQKAAFNRFAGALPNDPSLGMHAAVTLLSKEHAVAMKNKGNENYFYLLNLQEQAIAQLSSKERIQNAVVLAAKEMGIEENIYNPQHQGLATRVTGQLKSMLVERMPELVQGFVHDPRQLQENANKQFDVMSENWFAQISVMQEKAVKTKSKAEPKGKNLNKIRENWDKSANKSSKLAFQFDEVKQLVNRFHDSAMAQWKDSTIALMTTCSKLGGPDFFNQIIKQLNDDYAKLQEQGAHESYGKEIQKQIVSLKGMLSADGKSFNPEALKVVSPEILKLAFDGMRNSVANMGKNDNVSLDAKENLYMMSQAMSTMNTSYRTFDLAKKAYEEVYRTHFDVLNEMSSSKVATFIAEKLGAKLEESLVTSMSSPVVQFEYFAKQKIAGHHKLPDALKAMVEEQPQGWLAWGKDQVFWAASYLAPIAGPVAAKAAEIAALPALIGAGSLYLAKLYLTDVAPDPKSVNQAVCDNAKTFIREQAYDAMTQLLPEMFRLHETERRFQQNHATANYDPFKECGLGNRKRFYDLMNQVAIGLGHKNINAYMDFETEIAIKTASVERCKAELAATWYYTKEPKANLVKAEEELAILLNIKEDKRKQFSRLPENQAQLDNDLFVTLKDAIQTEYAQLTDDIRNGKLEDGTNYLVMVSSINAMIQQIELVQKETIAAELFAPDIDTAIGYNAQDTGVMAQLKLAGREDLKSLGSELARRGILSQLTEAIDTARYFSGQLINAVSEDIDVALNKHIQSQPTVDFSEAQRPKPITTAFAQGDKPSLNQLAGASDDPTQEKDVKPTTRPNGP